MTSAIETNRVIGYLDDLLNIAHTPDYPGAVNGLQLDNNGTIRKVAAAVDFSSRAVALGLEEKADLLLVHHGMFWSGIQTITGSRFERMKSMIEGGMAVYSAHLPLDCHPTFGNNMLLSRELELEPNGPFAHFKTFPIGVRGKSDMPLARLVERVGKFSEANGGSALTTSFKSNTVVGQWAMCTGGGASADTLQEAAATGIETLIVGEGPHWTAVEADDSGLVIIYAGHYATETVGVRALAQHVAERFNLEWTFIHAPTGR